MNKKQDRRTISVPTDVHDNLCYLQASVRVLMNGKSIKDIPSKTAMTNVIKALIENADVPSLAKLLK